MIRPAVLAVLVLSSALALEARADDGPMALLPLATGQNAPEDVLRVEGALRASIESVSGRRLESPASTRELIKSARSLGVDCRPTDLECLLKLSVLVGIDTLIVPSVSLGQGAFELDLVLIDTDSKGVTRSVQHTISPHSETFGKDIEGAAVDLLAPERFVGTLELNTNVSGAEVKLNNEVIGRTPLKEPIGARVGQHVLVVSKAGASPFSTLVEVRYGATTTVEATLQGGEGVVMGGGDAVFLSGVTLASVGGALGLIAGVGAMGAELFLYGDEGAYEEREAVKNTGVVLLTTSAASLLVAAAGGGLLLLSMGE